MEDETHPILMGLGIAHTHTRARMKCTENRLFLCRFPPFRSFDIENIVLSLSPVELIRLYLLRVFAVSTNYNALTNIVHALDADVQFSRKKKEVFVCAFAKNTRRLLHSRSHRNETNVQSIAFISNSKHIKLIRSNTLTPSKHIHFGCFCLRWK